MEAIFPHGGGPVITVLVAFGTGNGNGLPVDCRRCTARARHDPLERLVPPRALQGGGQVSLTYTLGAFRVTSTCCANMISEGVQRVFTGKIVSCPASEKLY